MLLALRLGDSAFPSGGFAFSWGLETALRDGRTSRAGIGPWLAQELGRRWAPFDCPALAGGWRAGPDPGAWDRLVDECLWAEAVRVQSAAAGAAFLTATAAMGLPGAAGLRDAVAGGALHGHLAVMQGAVWRAAGLPLETALALSGQGVARALVSAAVRLGALGAIAAQRHLAELAPLIARHAESPPPEGTLPAGFAPVSDVALLRPAPDRLFVN
ncbi:urease accessory protein UreF [Paroceanicella profunda]|uniref:urease accessory protein UreF n=1 Tax=Paroceanicella profunda TaxID=2579971 RepID=UPI001478FCF7|nr:urease accessory UreF family protein [Paroceanicella profunda]